jgi:translation initiation factor 3 subunit E
LTLNHIEFAEKKEKVLAQLEEFQNQTQNVIEVIENPEVIAALRQDKLQNLSFLKENYNVRLGISLKQHLMYC